MSKLTWCAYFLIVTNSAVLATDSYDLYSGIHPISRLDHRLPEPVNRALAQEHISVGSLTIGKSTFDDVLSKYGSAEIFKAGDQGAAMAPNAICYSASKDNDDTVFLVKSGPLGGWHQLTTISVTRSAFWKHPRRCSRSPHVDKHLATASGIRLGLPIAGLIKILGKPKLRNERFFGYYFQVQEGDWARTTLIEGGLEGEVVVSFTLNQIVSN